MKSNSTNAYPKRALDVLVAGTACAVFTPLVAGIAVATWLIAQPQPAAARRLDRLHVRQQSLLVDLQLIALSCAVNVAGKRRVRRWLRAVGESDPASVRQPSTL